MEENIIKINNISKKFGGIIALDNICFNITRGSVHAIIGENGAGKSTLMNVMAGYISPDSGSILFNEEDINNLGILQRRLLGISMVQQEINVFPNITVAKNVFAAREIVNKLGVVKQDIIDKKTKKIIDDLRIRLNPDDLVENLTTAEKQLVQIVSALAMETKVVIMDEPNSALTDEETTNLFRVLRALKEKGVTIIYISHRLEEVLNIADDITVLRDGKYVNTVKKNETKLSELVEMMVGRSIEKLFPDKINYCKNEEIFSAEGLSGNNFSNISFKIRRGEILGVAGLQGSGQTDLAEAIMGIKPFAGKMKLDGKAFKPRSVSMSLVNGISYIPPERRWDSIFPLQSVKFNLCISSLMKIKTKFGTVSNNMLKSISSKYVKDLGIKLNTTDQGILECSGGNQQKVVFAKALAVSPKLLVLNEPTRGIDVGAKIEIYSIMQNLAGEGYGFLFISSELEELMALSDKIIVFREGLIVDKIFDPKKDTKRDILNAMMGGKAVFIDNN